MMVQRQFLFGSNVTIVISILFFTIYSSQVNASYKDKLTAEEAGYIALFSQLIDKTCILKNKEIGHINKNDSLNRIAQVNFYAFGGMGQFEGGGTIPGYDPFNQNNFEYWALQWHLYHELNLAKFPLFALDKLKEIDRYSKSVLAPNAFIALNFSIIAV